MSKLFDSHCHPNFPQYDADRDEMLARAESAGVSMICVGTDLETSKQAVELAQKYENIFATVGVHPIDADHAVVMEDYEKLLIEPKVIAIGEIGLDYYRTPEPEKQEQQKEVFKQFLDLASKYDKPVIIHSRDAGKGSVGIVHADVLVILKNNLPARRGVAHSFTGTTEEAQKYIDLGFYLGFNGIITFARQYDEMVRSVPLERILIETDAPFLAPEPYRGQRNEPAYVLEVAQKLAEIKNEPLEKIIDQTTQNCQKLFKIRNS